MSTKTVATAENTVEIATRLDDGVVEDVAAGDVAGDEVKEVTEAESIAAATTAGIPPITNYFVVEIQTPKMPRMEPGMSMEYFMSIPLRFETTHNGYVEIPAGHPFFGLHYDQLSPYVETYYGLSYSGKFSARTSDVNGNNLGGKFLVGFDGCHGTCLSVEETTEYCKRLLVQLNMLAADEKTRAEILVPPEDICYDRDRDDAAEAEDRAEAEGYIPADAARLGANILLFGMGQ